LQEAWKRRWWWSPKPRGGGKLAVVAVTGARPNGNTLLFATPTFTLATAMLLATYDFAKDFSPAALMGVIAYTMVASPSVQANSVAELVALAKQQPGQINCGSAGYGTVPHLACETFNKVVYAGGAYPLQQRQRRDARRDGQPGAMFVAVSTVASNRSRPAPGGARDDGAALGPAAATADARRPASRPRDAGLGG
jgi:hypothetical protein